MVNVGERDRAIYGEVMHAYAKFKKVGGIVIDGLIRDVDAIREMGIPIYATGSIPCGPRRIGPGEVNAPVTCGGVQINPGDIVLGDGDGIVVVPGADAETLLPIAQEHARSDVLKVEAALNGSLDRSWVDKTLADRGCEIIDAAWQKSDDRP